MKIEELKEIEDRLNALKDIKIHQRDKIENKLLLAKGERLYEEALGKKQEYIGELLQRFERILSRQDEREIGRAIGIVFILMYVFRKRK